MILLDRLPMPPSSNNQYIPVRIGGKTRYVPSKELSQFKKSMDAYAIQNKKQIDLAKLEIERWRAVEAVYWPLQIELSCHFYFTEKELWTLKKTPKKMDVSNRLKAAHDGLSKLIGLDDSYFFNIEARKMTAPEEKLSNTFCAKLTLGALLG